MPELQEKTGYTQTQPARPERHAWRSGAWRGLRSPGAARPHSGGRCTVPRAAPRCRYLNRWHAMQGNQGKADSLGVLRHVRPTGAHGGQPCCLLPSIAAGEHSHLLTPCIPPCLQCGVANCAGYTSGCTCGTCDAGWKLDSGCSSEVKSLHAQSPCVWAHCLPSLGLPPLFVATSSPLATHPACSATWSTASLAAIRQDAPAAHASPPGSPELVSVCRYITAHGALLVQRHAW